MHREPCTCFDSGPFSSFLINLYGERRVSIGGTLVGCSGLVLSVFSNDVYTLYVTFGLITGNLAAALVVSRHVGMAALISLACIQV